MEENENKKNARIFYLTLAVIMTAVIVLVIATTVARRNLPDNDINTNDTNSSLNNDQQTGIEDPEDQIPEFTMPVSGELSVDFSDSIPVFSQTMNDYRTHLGPRCVRVQQQLPVLRELCHKLNNAYPR